MLSAALLATAQKTPESMLGSALHQEEVQGDLKGAIAAYQKVVATPGVSRKTAAEALVRMGQCYEKLGDSESRKAYERVLREYADQKEAAGVARERAWKKMGAGRQENRLVLGWSVHATRVPKHEGVCWSGRATARPPPHRFGLGSRRLAALVEIPRLARRGQDVLLARWQIPGL